MDPARLKREFGRELVFWGEIYDDRYGSLYLPFPLRHLNNVFTVDRDTAPINNGLSLSVGQHSPLLRIWPLTVGPDSKAISLFAHSTESQDMKYRRPIGKTIVCSQREPGVYPGAASVHLHH